MNIEADNVQIVALVNAFAVNLKICNLDSSITEHGTENYHEFTPFESPLKSKGSKSPLIELLYKPGHYDILCKLIFILRY